MFDINDNTLTTHKPDSPEHRMELGDGTPAEQPANPLDSTQNNELHTRLMSYYRQEMARQEVNRFEMAIDEDYYDHCQWTEEEAAVLKARGQAPIVYNVTAQTLNWIIGSEKRGRTDFKILPRGKEDAKPAEGKTKYMKYLSDVNRTPFHRSRAFEDAAKVGLGWLEVGVRDDDEEGEPIYTRYENWRNMIWDSAATEIDTSDMRYQFRSKWVDEDIAKMLAPDRAAQVVASVSDMGALGLYDMVDGDMAMDAAEADMNNIGNLGNVAEIARRRVRLIEAWYRRPENVKKLRGGQFNGETYDETHPGHKQAVDAGVAKIVSKGMMVTRVALMTPTALLYDGPSPFRHNRFKFIPVWGYRRGRDGLPYGVIRGLRNIQDAINKRASKALHILSTNKILMEEGSLPDGVTIDDFAEEAAKPDAILFYKRSSQKPELNVDRGLEAPHLDQMSRDIGMIQQVGGVTDELMGRQTNATSGVAVKARQDQGSITTNKLFDNLRLAVQMEGELELALMEQYVTEEKQFRITNQRGVPEFVTVNDGLPENDITRAKADFIISEADWRASIRQAANEQLGDMMQKLPPQVVMVMLDLFVEGMDIENRDEMVKRIRSVTGQKDPDQTEPTPEEQANMAAQQKAQAVQEEQVRLAMDEQAAKTDKTKAETKRIEGQMIGDAMLAADQAMVAATSIITMPTIAKVADNLLVQAGWKGVHTAPNGLTFSAPQQIPPQMQPQQQMQAQQAPPAPQAVPPGASVAPVPPQ